MKNQWIGIQFNLVDGGVIRSKESFKAMGIEFTSNHVVIKFTQKELKKFNLKVDSEKLRIILSLLREYLAKSDYTNIYTYLDADKLSLQKSLLNQSDFKEPLIRTKNIIDESSFIDNFKGELSQQRVFKLVQHNFKMKFMDAVLTNLVNRDFALTQQLTLELAYEEWGIDIINANQELKYIYDKK